MTQKPIGLKPHLILTGKDISGPIVYVHKRNGVALYVGRSSHGLRRPLTHLPFHMLTDSLDVYYCNSKDISITMELKLIKYYKPIDNRTLKALKTKVEKLEWLKVRERTNKDNSKEIVRLSSGAESDIVLEGEKYGEMMARILKGDET